MLLASLFERLKERKLVQWGVAYLAGAWVFYEATSTIGGHWDLPNALFRVLFVILAIGLFLTLVFAWFHGEKGQQRVSGVELMMVAGLLVVAGAVLSKVGFGTEPTHDSGRPGAVFTEAPEDGRLSLAVLPFENLSLDPQNDPFSQGMTASIITKLSQVSTLHVIDRTSVARFRGTTLDAKDIGRQLGVRYLIEGEVQNAEGRVHISVRMTDLSTGFLQWSDDFEDEFEGIFSLQDSVALEIVRELGIHLNSQEAESLRRRYTDNTAAYDAYLNGWAIISDLHGASDEPEKLEAARRQYERAIAMDSTYALAIAGIGHIEFAYWWFRFDRSEERLGLSEQWMSRALELDPDLSEAHATLGDILVVRGDNPAGIDEFQEAVRLDPNNWYAWEELAFAFLGLDPPDADEAEWAARQSIRIRPDDHFSHFQLARALRLQDRLDEALEAAEQSSRVTPGFAGGYRLAGLIHRDRREYQEALARFEELYELAPTPR
ncbi:hypothetical protein ACFL3S_07320, partial [Gemmatimonadota bacterium]